MQIHTTHSLLQAVNKSKDFDLEITTLYTSSKDYL